HNDFSSFSHQSHLVHLHTHSFPTRRSSDLSAPAAVRPLQRGRSGEAGSGHQSGLPCRSGSEEFPGASERSHPVLHGGIEDNWERDRKSTRLNSSHEWISYAVFCLKKKN